MKSRFANLKINAYGSRFETATKGQKDQSFAVCKNYIATDATDMEKLIHSYLDSERVFMMDVKSILADNASKECISPVLAAQFTQKNDNKLDRGPSFLQRRLKVNASTEKTNTPIKIEEPA